MLIRNVPIELCLITKELYMLIHSEKTSSVVHINNCDLAVLIYVLVNLIS